jgi:hypothetical protein
VAFEAVSIEGVRVFETEESRRNKQRQFRGGVPLVTEGTVLALDLGSPSRYVVTPGPIPPEESAVTALCLVPGRSLYGLTTGRRAHLFCVPRTMEAAPIAPLEGGTAGRALVRSHGETLIGAVHEPGKGSRLFAYNAGGDMVSYYSYIAPPVGKVEMLGAPLPGEEIVTLVAPGAAGVVYGLTADAVLFGYDARRRRVLFRTRVAPEAVSPVLADDGQGRLCGVGPEGYLYRFDPATRRAVYLDARVPAQRGRHYVAGANQLLAAQDGWMYGGTRGDGYLFGFAPASGELVNLGKPLDGDLTGLVRGRGRRLYGIAGNDVQHLFTFDLGARSFCDLGVVSGWVPAQWSATAFGAIAVGDFGEVYLGVRERLGHVMVYFPPVPA